MNKNMKPKRDNTFCCVPQCSSKGSRDPELSFHMFPKDTSQILVSDSNDRKQKVNRKMEWIRLLKIGKTVSKRMRVCSKHFKSSDYTLPASESKKPNLKSVAVPSEYLPMSSSQDFKKLSNKKQKAKEREARYNDINKKKAVKVQNDKDLLLQTADDLEAANSLLLLCTPVDNNVSNAIENYESDECEQTENETTTFEDKSVSVCSGDLQLPSLIIASQMSEQQLKTCTGIHSHKLLNAFEERVKMKLLLTNKHSLPLKERIILTFMKLKLDLSFASLGTFFGMSGRNCSRIFCDVIVILAQILENHVEWLGKEEIACNIPKCFKGFENVRVVLDCTEIKVQKPKCLVCRGRTYSQYKGTHTIKYLFGVSPGGIFTFVSNGYGGRTSDRIIFEQSNVVQMLEPHIDAVMVDRGFLIDNICEENFISIIRPPFLQKKKRFIASEAKQTRKIAQARIHVERCIQRLKQFKFLTSTVPFSLLPQLDEIIVIAAAMANLGAPILADDKF